MAHAPVQKKRNTTDDEDEDDSSRSLPPPPDGGWGWVVVFASFMIHIVTDGVTYSFGVFYVKFLDYFGESKGATAWIVSLLVGVTLCSGPVSSALVNKYGCRRVTIVGAILASVCMASSIFAKNVLTLYFTIGIGTGFGFGLIYLPAIVSVTCYFEKYRSLATGIAVCGSGLGTFIFAPLTNYLVVEYDWQGALLIISALVLNCIILGALFRPVPVVKVSRHNSVAEIPEEESILPPHKTPAMMELVENERMNTSEHNLHLVAPPLGESRSSKTGIHRPHSIGNFALPRPTSKTSHGSSHYQPRRSGSQRNSDIARLALSQPVLVTSGAQSDYKLTYGSQSLHRKTGSGIMYRKDIFYRGSLHNIPNPQNKSNPWIPREETHVAEEAQLMVSSSRISNGHIYRSTTIQRHQDRVKMCGCVPCSRETRDTFTEMLDFSLFKDPIFIIFTISNFFTSIGFNVPYVYIVAQAEERGVSKEHASYLLAIIGIANTVGRIVLGYICDKPWVNRLMVYNVCLTICGLGTAFSAFCNDFYSFGFYAALFGITIGAYVGLTSVILVDLLGLDKLTNAFGLLLLFQGLASFVGPPIAGWLYDALDSYDPGFYMAGFFLAVSGVMLFTIPTAQRYLARRADAKTPMNGAVTLQITAPSP